MAFSVSSATAYVAAHKDELFTKMVAQSKTLDNSYIVEGTRGSKLLPIVTVNPNWQSACSDTDSGSVDLTDVTVTAVDICDYKTICAKTANGYVHQEFVNNGGDLDQIFIDTIIGNAIEENGKVVDRAIWISSASYNGNGVNYSKFDGLLHLIADADASVVNIPYTGSTVANIGTHVNAQITNLPADLVGKELCMYMGSDNELLYKQYLATTFGVYNLANIPTDASGYMLVPGFPNIKIVGTQGLNGTGAIVTTYPKNILIPMDTVTNLSEIEFEYSAYHGKYAMRTEFALGAKIMFLDHVVANFNTFTGTSVSTT